MVREPHHRWFESLTTGGSRASPRTDVPPAPARPFEWFESLTTVQLAQPFMVREPVHLPPPSRSGGSRASPLTDVPPVPAQPFEWFESLTTSGRSTCPSPAVRMVREPHHERTFHPPPPVRSNGSRASPRTDVPPAPAQPFEWFESLTTNRRSTCPRPAVRVVREPHHERAEAGVRTIERPCSGHPHADDGHEKKYGNQRDGQLEQGLLQSPASAPGGLGGAEKAAAALSDLGQDNDYDG